MMTIEKDYQDLISAFAFGCLDIDEQSSFINNLSHDQYFNWYELGEFQNFAALLPSILTIEKPGDDVKAKVAQKLYAYKDEIRAKKNKLTIEKEPEKTITDVKEKLPKQDTIEDVKIYYDDEKPLIKKNIKSDTEDIEIVTSERKKDDLFRPSQATQILGRDFRSFLNKKEKHKGEAKPKTVEKSEPIVKKQDVVEKKDEIKIEEKKSIEKQKVVKEPVETTKKSTYVPIRERKTYLESKAKNYTPVIFLLFILMIAGFLWLYFSTNSKISKLQQEIDRLKFQVSGLSTSIKTNNDLQGLLTTKNVSVVNLTPTKFGNESYGKLIISFDKNQGFFQMFNMPELEKNMSYQLWVNISKSYYSLGVFFPSKDDSPEYYLFKLPQLSGKQRTAFFVSKETKLGANKPGKLIYLQGQL